MFKTFLKDRLFFTTFISLVLPMAFQNFIQSTLNMVDTVMVGRLGEAEIASVGLANQVFFLLCLFMFGVSSGAAIFTAQFWGKKDVQNIRRVLGLSLIMGITVAFFFTIAAIFIPKYVLGIFSKDLEVIFLGSKYLRITAFSYILTAITFSYAFALRSTGQVKLPMRVSVCALLLNTLLNYLLIFGNLGFPAMGVSGAAIATVISRLVETAVLLSVVYFKGSVIAAKVKDMLDLPKDFIKKFLITTIPVILNESLWSVGVTMYAVVYARMGTGVLASINIASTVERLAFVLFIGMANACAVMVGHEIGSNEETRAFDYAKRFIVLGPLIAFFVGIVIVFNTGTILSVFNVSTEVRDAAARILMIFGFIIAARVFNMIIVVGILRSGGDTTFCLIMDTVGVWFIAVPLAFLGGLVWKLPIHWVYLMVMLEEVFKLIFGISRFVSRKWINNLVTHA